MGKTLHIEFRKKLILEEDMLDNHGFDIWADGYDKSVNAADDDNDYPFAGYKNILNAIYGTIMEKCPVKVLDVGVGTGTLSTKLYEGGNDITAIDFSEKMLSIANAKMPKAKFYQFDFTKGIPTEVASMKFDFIVSTYALHHLTDEEKVSFIRLIVDCINDAGVIIIGDVSFQNRDDLEHCKHSCGDEWDDDEFYFVFSELSEELKDACSMTYHQYSHCGGIMEIRLLK